MAVNRPQQVGIEFVDPEQTLEAIETQLAPRGRAAAQALLLIGIVWAVYAVALRGSFIFVDEKVVLENALLRQWSGLWPIWIHPTILPHYQPLAYSAFLVEFKLFALQPAAYLTINV